MPYANKRVQLEAQHNHYVDNASKYVERQRKARQKTKTNIKTNNKTKAKQRKYHCNMFEMYIKGRVMPHFTDEVDTL